MCLHTTARNRGSFQDHSPQQIESADHLIECEADLPGDKLLFIGENHRIAHFLPLRVPLHLAVQRGRLASFGVGVIRPHCIDLRERAVSQLGF